MYHANKGRGPLLPAHPNQQRAQPAFQEAELGRVLRLTLMARFAVTIFLSAFLLFQVQPLIGKYILPWFGGGPAVWTICLLFFQLTLLIGYGYSHLVSSRFPARTQMGVHLTLLALSLLALPIAPSAEIWKPEPGDSPILQILLLLIATIGLPYLLLSSTAPLIQRWFSTTYPARSPYTLYALSNTGSLLALLSYPFLVEPLLALHNQVLVWSAAYAGFVALSAWCVLRARFSAAIPSAGVGVRVSDPPGGEHSAGEPAGNRPGIVTISLWLGFSAVGSALLVATTNQMCQEVAVIPFLWVLPLAIYLLTFILSFGSESRYDRRWFGLLVSVMIPLALMMMVLGLRAALVNHIAVYSLTLFACCMLCHGELVKSKPHPQHLTLFYFVISAGGALGGVFVALIAPRILAFFWEYPSATSACAILALIAWYRDKAWKPYLDRPYWILSTMTGMFFAIVSSLVLLAVGTGHEALLRSRSFYGILRLTEEDSEFGPRRVLTHGRVVHGSQFMDQEKRSWPTAYYSRQSAIGLAMAHHPRRKAALPRRRSLRIGVVGLGAGTIAALAQPGDYIRFYEINPDVVSVSEQYFSFCEDSAAEVDVIVGDARVRMEAELSHGQNQDFDILAVDAFSSDAVPVHLLTRESAETYWRHIKPDGLLLFHISNQTLDLEPVVRGLAEGCNCKTVFITNDGEAAKGISQSSWAVVTRNEEFLHTPEIRQAASPARNPLAPPLVWTDDFASLWQVLKF